MYIKTSRTSRSGETNVHTVFVCDTFEHVYDVFSLKKFSGEGRVIGNNELGSCKLVL